MLFFITVLHVVLCLLLILIIILQPGKGSDVASAFGGGGGGAVFGPRGPTSLLSRATTVVAVMFMVTSITLALNSDRQIGSSDSIEDQIRQLEEEEAKKTGAATPEAATPAPPATVKPAVPETSPEGTDAEEGGPEEEVAE